MSNLTPKVPGQTVETQLLRDLRSRVKELVGVSNFPGAQPISFTSAHLQELQTENYFVCEKTDGTRVLVYITCDNSGQQVFLIDRKNYYRLVPNLYFPIHNDPTFSHFHYETLIDGELVNDSESDGKVTLKLLTFDLLVIDKKDLMSRPLTSRLGYLKDHIIGPHKAMLSKCSDLAQIQPFVVELKQMELSYGLDKVLKEVIPNLKHKSDGLIFTSSTAGYKTGTCEKMLKWKPPHENSIDFQLYLDFSHVKSKGEKPRFCLYKWMQKDDHAYFGEMYVTDKEWEEFWRHDYNKYNGRIAEVVYDYSMNPHLPWRFIRFRDDKPHANHHTVVEKIIQSIMDGITQEQLLSHTSVIRNAWKRRDEEDKRREEDNRLKRVHEDKSENEESLANDNRPKRVKHDHEEDKFENEDKGAWKEESSANDTQSLKHDHENVKKLQYEEDENRISNGYLEYTAKNNKEEEENPSETLY